MGYGSMETPFPGMDPYLEHPALWPSFHTRMIVALANLLHPRIRPRYVASVEDRVFPQVEVREHYIEIKDRCRDFGVVTVIELVSPSNKATGPGRDSYLAKQREIRASQCHLVEIDLLRRGSHVTSVPGSSVQRARPFDYLACVDRWPARNRFELYPCNLRDPLPTIGIPLADPDLDAPLAIQRAVEHVYETSGYELLVKYDEPCIPPLSPEDQAWASAQWQAYRRAHPELFPDANGG
jgi:hypothetical protein